MMVFLIHWPNGTRCVAWGKSKMAIALMLDGMLGDACDPETKWERIGEGYVDFKPGRMGDENEVGFKPPKVLDTYSDDLRAPVFFRDDCGFTRRFATHPGCLEVFRALSGVPGDDE